MARLFSLLTLLLSVGATSAFTATPIRRPTVSLRHDTKLVLDARAARAATDATKENSNKIACCVRSAFCCLRPALVSKFLGSVETAGGLAAFVGAEEVSDFIGLKPSPSVKLYMKMKGLLSMGAGITALGTIVKGMSVVTAFGYSLIPLLAGFLVADFNKEMRDQFDIPRSYMALGIAMAAGTIYGCLTGTAWASCVTKIFAAGLGLEGAAVTFSPKTYYGLFGLSTAHLEDQDTLFASKMAGVTEAHFGVLVWALTQGVVATQALGYSMIPYILLAWSTLYSGTADDLGLNKAAIGTGSVVVPIATAALLI